MMIRINLLPQQYRRSERTSPKVFAATLGAVVATCSMFGWLGLVYFGELGELQRQHELVAEQLQRKQTQAAYYDKLEAQRKSYVQRVNTIQQIGRSRMLWTKVLDETIDVVNNNNDLDRHLAWFDNITIQAQARRGRGGPTVRLPGYVQGGEISRIANLHVDLKKAPYWVDVATKTPPQGTKETDQDKVPPEAYKFDLKIDFKKPGQWVKNAQQSGGGAAPEGRK